MCSQFNGLLHENDLKFVFAKFWFVIYFVIVTLFLGSCFPTFLAFKCKRIEFYDLYDLEAFEQGFLTLFVWIIKIKECFLMNCDLKSRSII